MKVPWWKRWLSYIAEIHIESTSSEFNPHLYVSLLKGRYQLCTANAIYSFEDLYDNFGGAFDRMDLKRIKGKEALILGLGLGSIPQILDQKGYPFKYTAVEIDEEVIYLVSKYALPQIQSPIEIVCADALNFVTQCQRKFDFIMIDIFLDDVIPDKFQNQEFLAQVKTLLNPEGILMYNRLAFTSSDVENAKTYFQRIFSKVFTEATFLEVKGNWMLLNQKSILTE